MTSADKPSRYAATQYDKTGKRAVWLTLHPDSLCIEDGKDVQFWPLSDVYVGQIGQGEAECIGLPARPDLRLFVTRDVLTMVKAAIKGEPYTRPRPWHIPVGPVLLFGFLGLCALIWYFFD
ncbi:MAG TPA: hypothetical protein ENK61_05340 [Devosia sp.]|nr:hypothetical protein [Devosia sp.]